MEEVLDGVYELQMPRPDLPEHLVVSRDEPISCHLIDGETRVLLGTGYALSAASLVESIESVVDDLNGVIVEHGDSDHYGALPQLQERFGDVTIAMPAEDVGSIVRIYAEVSVDRELVDGDSVFGLDAIAVPGHTRGNMSFLDAEKGILYVGDTFVGSDSDVALEGEWSGPFAPPAARYNADHEAAIENLSILSAYEFESALLTHGSNVRSGADDAFQQLLADIERR